jgi:outer membrane protein TolC
VLTAQKALLTAEQQWVDSTATVSTNLVALYKALGGGWDVKDSAYAALSSNRD